MSKIYIDSMTPRGAEIISQYLEMNGYRYGYNGRGCERRAAHNMRFITVDRDMMMYSGSKGAATNVFWKEFTEADAQNMLNQIKQHALAAEIDREPKYHRLSAEQYLIVQEFKDEFSTEEYRSMCQNFGRWCDDVSQLNSNQINKCISMMQEKIGLLKARRMMGDYRSIQKNQRLVMSKDESKLERVWVTATGREMPISRMKDDHLHNTILKIDRSISNGEYRLGANEDLPELLAMMEAERIERGMPMPLIPIKSLEWRKQND